MYSFIRIKIEIIINLKKEDDLLFFLPSFFLLQVLQVGSRYRYQVVPDNINISTMVLIPGTVPDTCKNVNGTIKYLNIENPKGKEGNIKKTLYRLCIHLKKQCIHLIFFK